MTPRKVSFDRGAGWIVDGVTQAGPVLPLVGAMALLIAVLAAPVGSMLVLAFVVSLLSFVLQAGAVWAIEHRRRGGTVGLEGLFAAFSQPGALARVGVVVGLYAGLVLVLAVAFVAVMLAFAGADGMQAIAAEVAKAETGGQPNPAVMMPVAIPMLLLMVVAFPLLIVAQWVLYLALPRAMLDGRGGLEAIGDGLRALGANLPAVLVNAVSWVVIALVMAIPLLILGALFSALPWPLVLLPSILVSTVFGALAMLSMHRAWLEIWGPAEGEAVDAPAPAQDHFEA
jgi:hypothetical protein